MQLTTINHANLTFLCACASDFFIFVHPCTLCSGPNRNRLGLVNGQPKHWAFGLNKSGSGQHAGMGVRADAREPKPVGRQEQGLGPDLVRVGPNRTMPRGIHLDVWWSSSVMWSPSTW